jgi:hypothetical protein
MSTIAKSKYPKKSPGLHKNNTLQKIHQSQKIHIERLVNNFVIHQKILQPTRKLKQLFKSSDAHRMSKVVSLAGRPIIIIVFKYPAFDRHIPVEQYACKPKQPSAEVIATCPSYICAFDYQTYDILDIVAVLGEIKCFAIHQEFVALKIAPEFGCPTGSLMTYALSPESYKFQQIRQPIEIGVEGSGIDSIEINYITLPTTNDTAVMASGPTGRLIIYARNGIQYGYSYNYDILFTYNHFSNSDSDSAASNWQFHKSAVINGLDIDITKYTHTDIFAGEDIEHRKKTKNTKNTNNKNDDEIRRIVSLSMDNSDITAAISELYKPDLLSYKHVSVNDYVLHLDGRLELVTLDLGRQPLVRGMNRLENLMCFNNYPVAKGGMEIIYKTALTGERPSGQLAFATNQITVKNSNNLEYQLQPGNILKYACMKNLLDNDYLYVSSTERNGLGNNIECSIYSPDGKYLAIHLKPKSYFSYEKRPIYDLNGIILYNRSAKNGKWREIGYISLPKSTNFKISFVAETNKFCEHLGYNLIVVCTDTNSGFPEYNILSTPTVLAEKYTELLSPTVPQLGHANLRNISMFLASAKSKYIDLVPKVAKQHIHSGRGNISGYKQKCMKLDI